MAFISIHEILTPQVILKAVSQIRRHQGPLGRWIGFQPDRYDADTVSIRGPNVRQGSTRFVSVRIDNVTRTVAKARAPGTGPATIPVNPVGEFRVSCARYHIKIPLLGEFLGNLSPIIGPNSQIDEGGQDYVSRQTSHIAQRMNNTIELMTIGALQDDLYFQLDGDDLLPVIGAPTGSNIGFQIPFQVPAGNKNQLDMLGTGSIIQLGWQNSGAPIIKNCLQIQAAQSQLTGYSVNHAMLNGLGWYDVLLNDEVRTTAGTSNTPFADYSQVKVRAFDGGDLPEFAAVLRGLPWLQWHIINETIVTGTDVDPVWASSSGGSFVKSCPDNTCYFLPDATSDWVELYCGAEWISENPGQPMQKKNGYTFWKEWVTQPSAIELIALMNAIPIFYIPKVVLFATTSGF